MDIRHGIHMWLFGCLFVSQHNFHLLGLQIPNLFQQHSEPVHKASSMKVWLVKVGVEELECPTLTSTLLKPTFEMNLRTVLLT